MQNIHIVIREYLDAPTVDQLPTAQASEPVQCIYLSGQWLPRAATGRDGSIESRLYGQQRIIYRYIRETPAQALKIRMILCFEFHCYTRNKHVSTPLDPSLIE